MDIQTTNSSGYENAMKPFEQYIRETDCILRSDEYILVHLDGLRMTKKYLRKMDEAERQTFSSCLLSTAMNLCNKTDSALIAYTCNDEIVLLLAGDGLGKNYHNRIQKLCSILAAKASVEMYRQLSADTNTQTEVFGRLKDDCVFAAKCFNLPKNSVGDYFKTRLLACKMSAEHKKDSQPRKEWEEFGYLITYSGGVWGCQSVDFGDKSFVRQPQDAHITLA